MPTFKATDDKECSKEPDHARTERQECLTISVIERREQPPQSASRDRQRHPRPTSVNADEQASHN